MMVCIFIANTKFGVCVNLRLKVRHCTFYRKHQVWCLRTLSSLNNTVARVLLKHKICLLWLNAQNRPLKKINSELPYSDILIVTNPKFGVCNNHIHNSQVLYVAGRVAHIVAYNSP